MASGERMALLPAMAAALVALLAGAARGDEKAAEIEDLAAKLRGLDSRVLPDDAAARERLGRMLRDDVRGRIEAANRRESAAWRAVRSLEDWERLRDERLEALRRSLGADAVEIPPAGEAPPRRLTRTLEGEGHRIECILFESRPGLWVSADLYLPAEAPASMPGIIICHSHHNPRTQGELQDMGMTWARLGAAVLVMDQLGHGERRLHPFTGADSYPRPFRAGRQDYYFRYNAGIQLHLAGESLIGWMVRDLRRGADLLLAIPGVDPRRIIIIGAVAGGGDPAAVAAALDRRIAAAIPFNFGGPQPETVHPLPADAEETFNYSGSGSWESTRNLRLSARDGFLPWVIVGSIAPRRLVYAHEFSWDRERDPVWKRLERIYSLYSAPDSLAAAHGTGLLRGQPPESSHSNNVGPVHRRGIYPALARWFGMPEPEREYQQRRAAAELLAWTPEAAAAVESKPLHRLAGEIAAGRAAAMRRRLEGRPPEERRRLLREAWEPLLGGVELERDAVEVAEPRRPAEDLGRVRIERAALRVEREITAPLLLLLPRREEDLRLPAVLMTAQEGKERLLAARAAEIAEMLDGGAAVCLLDPRGTGETRPADAGRGRTGAATALSSTELMLGGTLLGARLRDLRAAVRWLRRRPEIDPDRIALWGDALAAANPAGRDPAAPLDADDLPQSSEPLGGLLSLLGALIEEEVRAVYLRGGLVSLESILDSPFLYIPHDVVVPGAIGAGDLPDIAAALAPRPLRLESLVDGLNRPAAAGRIAALYPAADRILAALAPAAGDSPARWLIEKLRASRADDEPIRPRAPIRLFNGRDLDGLASWVKGSGREDPRGVFAVEDGAIRASGEAHGYIATTKAYRDYRLVVEYRWGEKTFGSKTVRNSGILLHATGPDGNRDPWMASIECQLAQGCAGDLIVIRGQDAAGAAIPVTLTSDTVLGPDRRTRWKRGGKPAVYSGRQFWWSLHDPEFQEKIDTRGRDDVESPLGEWTRVECIAASDRITVRVNGVEVNECYDVYPSGGRILLQSEGFEIHFRKFELYPLEDAGK